MSFLIPIDRGLLDSQKFSDTPPGRAERVGYLGRWVHGQTFFGSFNSFKRSHIKYSTDESTIKAKTAQDIPGSVVFITVVIL